MIQVLLEGMNLRWSDLGWTSNIKHQTCQDEVNLTRFRHTPNAAFTPRCPRYCVQREMQSVLRMSQVAGQASFTCRASIILT